MWVILITIFLDLSIIVGKGLTFSSNQWYQYMMFVTIPDLLRLSVFVVVYYFLKKAMKGDPNKKKWKIAFKVFLTIKLLFDAG